MGAVSTSVSAIMIPSLRAVTGRLRTHLKWPSILGNTICVFSEPPRRGPRVCMDDNQANENLLNDRTCHYKPKKAMWRVYFPSTKHNTKEL